MTELDLDAMVGRFKERAASVRKRTLPPVAGDERAKFVQQAQMDFQDFALIADAVPSVEDGVVVLRIDLRPEAQQSP